MPTKKPNKSTKGLQAGFNMIEVMVALGILAFGILAIASMQESSLLGTSLAYSVTDGTTRAMDQMEELLSRQWNNITSGGPVTEGANNRYTINWAVSLVPGTTDLKQITVTVNWTDAGFGSRSTTLTCYKYNNI